MVGNWLGGERELEQHRTQLSNDWRVLPSMDGVRLGERDVGRAAAELLAATGDRRKRGRPAVQDTDGKRRALGAATVNVGAARKAALALMRESPTYRYLAEVEERIDLAHMRKQQDIKEALKNHSSSVPRVFRLYLFNTFRSQPGAKGVIEDDTPSWSLRIQGQLFPPQNAPDQTVPGDTGPAPVMQSAPSPSYQPMNVAPPGTGAMGAASVGDGSGAPGVAPAAQMPTMSPDTALSGPPPRCSDIFSRIVIELDKDVYPENNLIEWKRGEKDLPSDGFEVSRAGSTEFTAKIFLYLDDKPERVKLSYALSRVLGVRTDTRSGIFTSMWQYIKKMGLQCVDDHTVIRLDNGLKSLLPVAHSNRELLKLQQVMEVVKTHLGPPDPLAIEYRVRLSGDVVDNQDCYDIQVNIEDLGLQRSAENVGIFGLHFPSSAEYKALSDKHLEALEQIAHHKRRRDFFEGFCANPVEFINHLILSQTRDLKVLGGSTGRNPEEERRASFYQQQWVHEAIPRYLLRKSIADTCNKTTENATQK